MTNLTLLELAAIAVALDEEGAERKRRTWAVHPAWSKREIEGEFVTLYKELIDDEMKFYGYFRMRENVFFALLEKVGPLLMKQRTRFQKPMSPMSINFSSSIVRNLNFVTTVQYKAKSTHYAALQNKTNTTCPRRELHVV